MRKRSVFCRTVGLAFLSAMFLLAGGAMAQDVDIVATEGVGVEQSLLGLGAAYVPDYEGSDDYEAAPLLQARFNLNNDMYFSLLGNAAKFNLIPSKTWHFGPMLRYRPERDDVDNDQVDRMEKVDAAAEVGAFINYNLPNWIFTVSVAQDVADAHDGYVIDLGAGYRFNYGNKSQFTLFAKTTYASDDYMETYFSVTPADSVRSGLRTFEAEEEWKDVGGGILLQHSFDNNWGLLAAVKFTRLLGDAEDSPLVDDVGDENQWLTGLAINYRF